MSFSLSRGRPFDAGEVGREHGELPPLAFTPEASRLDLREWWPEDRRNLPVELEIGSGKGTFLVQQATQLTDVNYLGIEWARQFYLYAADRIRRHGLPNVRMLHDDASVFVTWRVPDGLFRQVHIYFPDPWPKKRHHKRRLIQAPFLRQLHRVLQPAGMVRLVTDHSDYFAWMNEHVDQVTDLFDREAFDRPVAAGDGEVVGTNFERKYAREGRPFNAMTLKRK
jgi:tRNA (guanine-N7-)-methyltransferase